jgi:23S rRNA (uracil1939-C5)-methyltransferase
MNSDATDVTLSTSPELASAHVTAEEHATPPRYLIGRFCVRVDDLDATGTTHGRMVAVVRAPDAEQFARVYGNGHAISPQPETLGFVGGLPGELVEVEARWPLPRPGRKLGRRAPQPSVRVLSVLEAAPQRVTAPCPVFGECGGCQLQHMAYPAQLAWKTDRIRTLLTAAGFERPPVVPALGCDTPWHYRNHMRFSVNREGQPGLTARGTSRVLPLRACPIAHERINDALGVLADSAHQRPQLLVRYGVATGQILVHPAPVTAVRERLEALGLEVRDDRFEEGLKGHGFCIRPSSFFQTNTAQANRMADLVLAALPSGPDVTLVDAYCGVGTFARLLAERAGRVIAIEESASAIRDARYNLREAANVTLVQGKVEVMLPELRERLDGLVIDPPRAGCQRVVLDALAARRVPRVVYVSCGPDTLARDLRILCLEAGAYRLVSIQPLDMFPQTAHIETIATLEAVASEAVVSLEAS